LIESGIGVSPENIFCISNKGIYSKFCYNVRRYCIFASGKNSELKLNYHMQILQGEISPLRRSWQAVQPEWQEVFQGRFNKK
jgi:hypothetical protein